MNELSDHLDAVGETYLEHMGHAFGFGLRMVIGGLACLLHGLLPNFCVTTGSRTIKGLHDRMVVNRNHKAAPNASLDFVI